MAGSSLTLALLLFSLPTLWAPGPAENRKGNEALRKSQPEKAVAHYNKAAQALPGERAIAFNTGTALLAGKKYDDALKALMVGAGDSRQDVKTSSLYNSGNALFESQKFPEALSAYREAILANSSDMDAKFNYELAQYRLKKQQQEDKKNQEQNKDKKKDKQNSQNQNQKENQDQSQQNQTEDQQQQPKPDQGDEEQQPQPKPGEEDKGDQQDQPQRASLLSKEEAERLLDALKANEMEMIKARLKSSRKKNVEKDW